MSTEISPSNAIGERIRLLRQRLKLSQEKFGRPLGIGGSAISQIESGQKGISEPVVILLRLVYQVNSSWLLTGEGEMLQPEFSYRQTGMPAPDHLTEKILILVHDMDEEKRRDVLKYLEKEKLLTELLEERRGREEEAG